MYISVMDKNTEHQELLRKYLEGEATVEEKQKVENWYASFERADEGYSRQQKKQIGQELYNRIYSHPDLTRDAKPVRIFRLNYIAKVAASICLPLIVGLFAWMMFGTPKRQQQNLVKWVAFETKAGERKRIILSDSSEIWLNAASRVLYPEKFTGAERIIKLIEGEAFFNVSHNKKFPFRVVAPNGVYTRVLGTSFNINAYGQNNTVDVEVSSGKVAVGKNGRELAKLTKGQGLNVNRLTSLATSHATGSANAWTRNEIIFNDQSLKEAAAILSRTYGIAISIDENVNENLKCRGSFSMGQQPSEIIRVLCALHGLNYSVTAKSIIIKKGKMK